MGIQKGWKYEYDPEGKVDRLRWPWSKPDRPDDGPNDGPNDKPADTEG
jgi:hypothetical protein